VTRPPGEDVPQFTIKAFVKYLLLLFIFGVGVAFCFVSIDILMHPSYTITGPTWIPLMLAAIFSFSLGSYLLFRWKD
jgi:hypothetical protein